MKIGILTFHRAINYGAVLQCYALKETIKSLGHEVGIIDYRPDYIERHRQLWQGFNFLHTKSLCSRVKNCLLTPLMLFSRLDANRRFDSFIAKNFQLSKRINNIKDIESNFDVIIIGSDQVWSPKICYGFDPIYWGQFPHKGTKLISYAASLGETSSISDFEWAEIKKRIGSFECVSVRESQLKDELHQRYGIDTTCTIDPSLLLNKNKYDCLVEEPNLDFKYVIAFSVVETPNFIDYALNVASEMNCRLVLMSSRKPLIKHKNIVYVSPSIGSFLGLIKECQCVVTTSFHGTAFSIIYRKPFFTAAHGKSSRVYNLLSKLGLEDRIVDMSNNCYSNNKVEGINYDEAEKKLLLLVDEAKNYIVKGIHK